MVTILAGAIASGYFDDSRHLPSLMAPPYHIVRMPSAHCSPACSLPAAGPSGRPKTGRKGWVGQNGAGIAIFWQFGRNPDTRDRKFGTEWDKMGQEWEIPVPREQRIALWRAFPFCTSAIVFLCSHGIRPPKCDIPAVWKQGNRVLNAGGPISRHSRAGGNPNPRLPSHPEPKEALPLPYPPPFRPVLCAE